MERKESIRVWERVRWNKRIYSREIVDDKLFLTHHRFTVI